MASTSRVELKREILKSFPFEARARTQAHSTHRNRLREETETDRDNYYLFNSLCFIYLWRTHQTRAVRSIQCTHVQQRFWYYFLFWYILSIFCSFPSVVGKSRAFDGRTRKIHTYFLCFPFVVNHDKLINLIYLLCMYGICFGMCWYLFISLTHSLVLPCYWFHLLFYVRP